MSIEENPLQLFPMSQDGRAEFLALHPTQKKMPTQMNPVELTGGTFRWRMRRRRRIRKIRKNLPWNVCTPSSHEYFGKSGRGVVHLPPRGLHCVGGTAAEDASSSNLALSLVEGKCFRLWIPQPLNNWH